MDDKNDNLFDPNAPLILTNSIDPNTSQILISSTNINLKNKKFLNHERFKLKELINKKYSINNIFLSTELKSNLKNNLSEIKSKFHESEKKLEQEILTNKSLEINNQKLKKTITSYAAQTKNLEEKVIQFDKTQSNKTLVEELNNKVKFFQDENIRLSGEITIIKKKYETINVNFKMEQLEKKSIYKQIQELSDLLTKNNILDTPYQKEIISEDSVNAKVLNNISENNLHEQKNKIEKKDHLNESISDIFDPE